MLLSDFPSEILTELANYLPIEDKISCSLVCRSWTQVFQDSLYSDLFIQSVDKFREAVYLPQDQQQIYTETRHLVQNLHISNYIYSTKDELYALQNNFRNIKRLHINAGCLTSINVENKIGWHHWRLLRELYICVDYVPVPFTEKSTVGILACLPLLVQLDIFRTYSYASSISFSLDDFETIHSHLPCLTHLGMSSTRLSLSNTDLERMTKVSPNPKIKSFKMNSARTDHRWLCYFARKYPNLRTFEFCSHNSQNEDEEHNVNTISFLETSCLPFQHLRKLDMKHTNCHGKECLFFWEMIKPYNIPLNHVSVAIQLSFVTSRLNNPYGFPKYITETCLEAASKTIESFLIQAYEDHEIPLRFIDIKDRLYNLVELELDHLIPSIELDMLLEVMPRLKDILFRYTDVKVKGEMYNSKMFGLRSFRITGSTITSDVLRFLSFHCRELDVLWSIDMLVSGNFSVPGCQFIDMTYTRLNALFIKETRFIINDSKECPENLNIALITRPVDDILPKQNYDPKVSPIVIRATPTKAHYKWFYTRKFGVIKNISKSRGSRMEKFFSNYEKNKRITIERAVCSKKRNPYINWNNNCVFGYTKIKLGYVTHFSISSH